MRLRDYLFVLRRSLPLLVVAALLGAGLGWVASGRGGSGYASTVGVFAGNAHADAISVSQSALGVQRMATYEQLVKGSVLGNRIARRISSRRGAAEIAASLTVRRERDALVMQVTAEAPTPEEAEAVTRVLPSELQRLLHEVYTASSPQPLPITTFSLVDGPNTAPVLSARTRLVSAAMGGFLGLLLGAVAAAWRLRRNPLVRSADYVSELTGAPLVGVLPRAADSDPADQASTHDHQLSLAAAHVLELPDQVVVGVTSTRGVDPSPVTAALARALVGRGRSVEILQAGGGSLLVAEGATGSPRLSIQRIPGGTAGEPLPAAEIAEIVQRSRGARDVTLVELPDVPGLPGCATLLDHLDATVLAYSQRTSRERDVKGGVAALEAVTAGRVGLVAVGVGASRRLDLAALTRLRRRSAAGERTAAN
ncbi:MAG: hypothetical protein IPI32_01610 [Austwickia sp.]|nr:hypothetical protein [Austwickia sp.]MBK8437657.1 hypothetical protein [Austwickia sp.]